MYAHINYHELATHVPFRMVVATLALLALCNPALSASAAQPGTPSNWATSNPLFSFNQKSSKKSYTAPAAKTTIAPTVATAAAPTTQSSAGVMSLFSYSSTSKSTTTRRNHGTTPTPTPTPTPAPTPAPAYTVPFSAIAGVPFYTDPYSDSVRNGNAYMSANGYDAGLARMIAQPMATWFGDWSGNIQVAVNNYVSAAAASGKTPVLVAYNIPNRDCGSYSSGGAASAAAYQTWINGFAAGIGARRAIVILEPDAISATCYDNTRAAMLSQAITTFAKSSNATVYLDAGNAAWVGAGTVAARLNQSGVAYASGFSLNVSNFQTNAASITYGSSISSMTGGKHFVIDTSRNGVGPTADNAWCNPLGMALGSVPTAATGSYLADAYLWIKIPGESDGGCGPIVAGTSAPAPGVWWPQYAVMLVRNAGW